MIFHIYWANKKYYEGDELVAQLDWDDTDGNGPETVTVTVSVDIGTRYQYYIYDFSNGGSSSSKALSFSGARVNVYCGDRLIKTYSVPGDVQGTTWNVFEIVDGELVDINQINN